MNKKEFFKELEIKLSVLEEQEIKDILSEYKDIIESKVKDGKTEKEAVAEFGSIDELCSEVLKAYKINPKFVKNIKSDETSMKSFEEWIKNGASSMAKFFKGVESNLKANNKELNIELFFEIFIKIIILLVIFAVLKIPFYLIGYIGGGSLSSSFTPIDFVFKSLWWFLAGIVYLGLFIFVFWILFREYFRDFGINQVKEKSEKIKDVKKKEDKIEVEETKVLDNKSTTPFLIIIRIVVVVCFLLPLWLSQAVLIFTFFLTIYLFFTGINILGLIIIILGVLMALGFLTDFIYKLAFDIKKIKPHSVIPMIISIPVILLGGVIFAGNILSFDYIDEAPINDFAYTSIDRNFNIKEGYQIRSYSNTSIVYEIDDNYYDNEINVSITYPERTNYIKDIRLDTHSNTYKIKYDIRHHARFSEIKDIYNIFTRDLRNGQVYNYSRLYFPQITITGNSKTVEKLR